LLASLYLKASILISAEGISMKKRFVTTGEIAKICEVTSKTVIAWIEKKQLNSFRIGNGPRKVKVSDLYEFLVEKGFPVNSPADLQSLLNQAQTNSPNYSF
jgi:DNA-binding transcriptional MerR regulator